MRRLPLLLWVTSRGFLADGLDNTESNDEAESARRLHEWARHIEVIEHPPELLDERKQTPLLELSGLQLRHVVTVNRKNARQLGHAYFSDEYHKRRRLRERLSGESPIDQLTRDRRLSTIQSAMLEKVTATPFSFFTPRDRVRLFAALNGAALPEEAVANASRNYWGAGGLVHNNPDEKMAFTKKTSDISDQSLLGVGNWSIDLMLGNFSGNIQTVANSYRDGLALKDAAQTIKTAAGASWKEDHFSGSRSTECLTHTESQPRCWNDAGIALSLYEDTSNKIIVFHSDWSRNWYEYIKWHNRAWIIDEVESQIKNQWTIDARQFVTKNQADAKGEEHDEKQERCAFKDEANKPFVDISIFSARTDISVDKLNTEGYWQLVKKMVRIILPETRNRVLEKDWTIYLTGSGFGGVWSSLTSMWLKKIDDATYDSYSIAGGGFECLARSLTIDMSPWDTHTQVKIYAHVMDVYARMDFVSGYTCLYGGLNMTTGSDVHTFCSGIVGLTGPQLFYRGDPYGKYEDEATYARVVQGRKDFDACQYYTHSVWYAAMLFVDDKILLADGTTDGGCTTVDPIPQKDQLGSCPTASRVEEVCTSIEDTSQDLPILAMTAVASGLAGMIVCMACIGYICLQRMRNDMWVFGQDKRNAQKQTESCWQRCLAAFGMGGEMKRKMKKQRKAGNRAKQARDRAKQARLNRAHTEGSGGKKKKKKEETNEEEEWEALKDKLGQEFDAEQIGKADDALVAAARMMGHRSNTGMLDMEANLDSTEDGNHHKKGHHKKHESHHDGQHEKDKDHQHHHHQDDKGSKKDKDKDPGGKIKKQASTKDGPGDKAKPVNGKKLVGKSNSARPADDPEKKERKKHMSSHDVV